MLGFAYRQDAYWYMVIVDHLQNLLAEGFVPVGVTWLKSTYCGLPEVVYADPMYSISLLLATATGDFVLSWKLTVFLFYVMASLAMYYFVHVLTSDRIACLVSSTAYAFSQIFVFELFLGHLSMVVGFALIPLIIATYVKALRGSSPFTTVLSALLLAWLTVVRPDFAYFTISFMTLFFIYFILTTREWTRALWHTGAAFFLAFLLAYPILEPRYLSTIGGLTEHVGMYTFAFYSPEPYLLLIPYMKSLGVYLGITVLLNFAIGGLVTMKRILLSKATSETDKDACFFFTAALGYVLLGLGATTPLYGLLYNHVPFFSVFRVPTRWLVVAQLCLAMIAGIGASFTIRSLLKRTSHQLILTLAMMTIVFLDLSLFMAPSVYEEQGWRPLADYGSDSAFFVFPQTSYAPEFNAVYSHIRQDTSSSYRVLSAPIVYSRSYYHYVQYLRETEATLAYDYVQFPLRSRYQREVYNGFRYGNFTDDIGEQMALLGVKYLVYNFYWGEWERLVARMNETDDLKFLRQDQGYILFRNNRFGDVSKEDNLIEDDGFEESSEYWIQQDVGEGFSELDHTVSRSGVSSMKLASAGNDGVAARTCDVGFTSEAEKEYALSGWARAEDVYGENATLALQATVTYADGSRFESPCALFSVESHEWEYSSVNFRVNTTKAADTLTVSLILQNATGKAWFDDVYLAETRATDAWSGGYLVKELYTDVTALLSAPNKANATMTVGRENAMTLRLQITANEPVHVILSESYDAGWRMYPASTLEPLSMNEYNSFISVFVAQPGVYSFSLKLETYSESLNTILLYYGVAALAIALFLIPRSFYGKVVSQMRSFTRNVRRRQ